VLRMGRKPDQTENEVPVPNPAPFSAPNNVMAQPPAAPPAMPSDPLANQNGAAERSRQRAFTDTENLARDLKDGTISGFVGAGTVVQGEAAFKGMMRIDGHLMGSVKSEKGTVIISSGGKVDATIQVAVANVNGTVRGDIIASERIELGRSAHVTGNIQTPSLVIEQGAIFEGNCRMTAQRDAASRPNEIAVPRKRPEAVADVKPETPVVSTPAATESTENRVSSATPRPIR